MTAGAREPSRRKNENIILECSLRNLSAGPAHKIDILSSPLRTLRPGSDLNKANSNQEGISVVRRDSMARQKYPQRKQHSKGGMEISKATFLIDILEMTKCSSLLTGAKNHHPTATVSRQKFDQKYKQKRNSNTPFRSGDLRVMSPARFRCAMLLEQNLFADKTNCWLDEKINSYL